MEMHLFFLCPLLVIGALSTCNAAIRLSVLCQQLNCGAFWGYWWLLLYTNKKPHAQVKPIGCQKWQWSCCRHCFRSIH